jgi:hypothetical protein
VNEVVQVRRKMMFEEFEVAGRGHNEGHREVADEE